jgi:hypothetical protein
MESVEGLPLNFDQDVMVLEEGLRTCTLNFKTLKELFNLYKIGIEYYTKERNETRKIEFTSKYKYALNDPYVVQLMKKSVSRFVWMLMV